jgi:alpha-L-fucosidase 2
MVFGISLMSIFFTVSNVNADAITSAHALRIVSQYKGTFTKVPTSTNTGAAPTDAPLLGNGDVGVIVANNIDAMTFILAKNEFWSLNEGMVKAMARLSLSIPGMAGASNSMTQDISKGEVNGTFVSSGNTITTKSWVQGDNSVTNRLITKFTYSGSGTKSVAVGLSVGNQNTFPNSVNSSGDVLYIDVAGDNVDSVKGYATRKVRVATRVVGTTGTISNNKLNFTLSPGSTYSLVTCIMSNYDSVAYKTAVLGSISSITPADVDTLLGAHHVWWNNLYGKSFMEIPEKIVEKGFYMQLYLLACCSRTDEAAPGLYANWIMQNPYWNGDYTLNYNHETPFYFACPTNHTELVDCYDKAVIDWIPNAQALAKLRGWTGAYFPVHIGPLPNGSADKAEHNQKSMGAWVASVMVMHYYYTRDLAYAQKIYPAFKQMAIFYQNYLKLDPTGTRYMMYSDAQSEGDADPQTNGFMSLGLIRFLLKACVDISTDLNVDADFRTIWQDRLTRLSPYATFTRNGVTVFRETEVGVDWINSNSIGSQGIYPGSAVGLGSDPALLAIAKNTIDQMQRWGWGNFTFDPAAVRVGYNPATILSKVSSFISSLGPSMHSDHGIEDCDVAPATLCEMFMQTFQDTIRMFPVWPANTWAKFGDLMAYGGFLVSSDIENNVVQYMRVISNKGRSFTFYNPWPGQTLRIYRNGIDSGTVSGKTITINTSVNETIHLATNGTLLSVILERMSGRGGTIVGVANNPQLLQPQELCSIAKKLFDRTHDRTMVFSATSTYDDTKRMTVKIYSLNGVLIKELVSNGNAAQWNFTGNKNTPVPIGVYAYTAELKRSDQTIMNPGIFQIVR